MDYLIHLLIIAAIYAIVAVALNLSMGYTGLVSIMHAAFFGVGAYTTAILSVSFHWNFFVTLLLGMVVAAVLGYLVSVFASGLAGDYFMLVTVGFSYITEGVYINWMSLTNGPLGIPGVPRPSLFGFVFSEPVTMLALSVFVLVLVYLVARSMVRSSLGRVLKAIREDESVVRVFGYETSRFKSFVFSISAALASSAGSLFASYLRFVSPSSFGVLISVFVLAIVVFGGLASLKGSLIGALFLTLFLEGLRFLGFSADFAAQARQLIYGLMLVFFMLYRPKGLIGEYKL